MNDDDSNEKRAYDRGTSFVLCTFDDVSFPLSNIEHVRPYEIEVTWAAFGVYDILISRLEDIEE